MTREKSLNSRKTKTFVSIQRELMQKNKYWIKGAAAISKRCLEKRTVSANKKVFFKNRNKHCGQTRKQK
jgi:hypothetical protein